MRMVERETKKSKSFVSRAAYDPKMGESWEIPYFDRY